MQDSTTYKKVKYYKVINELGKIKHLFPCQVEELHISFIDNDILVQFINDVKVDVTSKILITDLSQEYSLYDYVKEIIGSYATINRKDDPSDTIYIHKMNLSSNVPLYFDFGYFRRLRLESKQKSVSDLAFNLGLNMSILYNIEKRINAYYSVDTLVKFSMFFKKPIFYFFSSYFGEQLLNICLINWMHKGLITKEIADKINADFKNK